MTKKMKIILTVGISLLLVGVITYTTLFFTHTGIFNIQTTNRTIELEEFNNIDIDVVESDVKILKSDDGKNKVILQETNKIYHNVAINNSDLEIKRRSSFYPFEWAVPHFNVKLDVTLYLNENALNKVDINTVSGNVEINNLTSTELDVDTVSGKIDVKDLTHTDLNLNSVSGFVNGENIKTNSFECEVVSSKVDFNNLVSTSTMNFNTVSGNLNLNKIDSNKINIKSVSANVGVNLLNEKSINTSTISGKIEVPSSTNPTGILDINTVSGNIKVTVNK